jgi:gamma-glutamyltranspeptidase/glutathione hydrolase
VDVSPKGQLGKPYAQALAPMLDELFAPPADKSPKHSNAIVVIDREGNIAAITHTINTVIWGATGIVVGGIPIPDSAGFQQRALAVIKPGDRVPHGIIDTIVLRDGQPVLATGSIGSSLLPEDIRVLLGALGQGQNLASLMAAPAVLATFDASGVGNNFSDQTVSVPQGAYSADFLTQLKARGVKVVEIPGATVEAMRGTLAAVAIDPKTGKRSAVNQPGVMVFCGVE